MAENIPAKVEADTTINVCPQHCDVHCSESAQESTERLTQINADNLARNRALTFSMGLSSFMILCFVTSSFIGRPLTLPQEVWSLVWVAIGAPWIGAGGGKITDAISQKIGAKK
jgi:hypothetical protein